MNYPALIHLIPKKIRWVALAALLLFTTAIQAIGGFNASNKSLLLHKQDEKPRMFLICVIDSNDDSIGVRCGEDLDGITYLFDEIADELDADMVEPKVISGEQFSKAAVRDAVDKWLPSQQPGANDIVVFYYSGHGFRYAKDASTYPRMWLKNGGNKNPEENNLSIESDIYDHIVKMGAGVNIVLSDCCNTYAPGDNANFDKANVPVRQKVNHKQPENGESSDDDDYVDKLFVPGHPVSILAAAADKGEFAAGKADVGGFFTYYLIEALESSIYDNKIEPEWENIFKYVDENAGYWAKSAACPDAKHNAQGRCIQTVEYRIEN